MYFISGDLYRLLTLLINYHGKISIFYSIAMTYDGIVCYMYNL